MEHLGEFLSQPIVWVMLVVGILVLIWRNHQYQNASPEEREEMDKQARQMQEDQQHRDRVRREEERVREWQRQSRQKHR